MVREPDSPSRTGSAVGLFRRPSVGVVVQSLLDAERGCDVHAEPGERRRRADDRGRRPRGGCRRGPRDPDNYLVDRSGRVVGRAPGVKKIAIRTLPDGGTVEKEVAPALVERPCSTMRSSSS